MKSISKEKETQYQYLQKILELVDTGILSYEMDSGEVVWMNESLKKLLQVPYLKTIHSLSKRDWGLYHEVMSLPLGESLIATAHNERTPFKVLLSATAFQTEGKIQAHSISERERSPRRDRKQSMAKAAKRNDTRDHELRGPISSLSATLKNMLASSRHKVSPENLAGFEDLELGIDTIRRRSEGLLKFAETYRNLNKISDLNLKSLRTRSL